MGYIRCAVKNSFKSLTTYRTFTVVAIISSVFGLLIQIAIWKALYNGQNVVHTESNQIYLSDMIQYAVFSMLISILINNSATSNIEKRISSGQVSGEHRSEVCSAIYPLWLSDACRPIKS